MAQLGFGFVLSAFPRADWAHIVSVYPVVWLLIFALGPPPAQGRGPSRVEWVGVSALLLVTGLLTLATHSRLTYPLRLERAHLLELLDAVTNMAGAPHIEVHDDFIVWPF